MPPRANLSKRNDAGPAVEDLLPGGSSSLAAPAPGFYAQEIARQRRHGQAAASQVTPAHPTLRTAERASRTKETARKTRGQNPPRGRLAQAPPSRGTEAAPRPKQVAHKSTGGIAPRKSLANFAAHESADDSHDEEGPKEDDEEGSEDDDDGSEDDDDGSGEDDGTMEILPAQSVIRVGKTARKSMGGTAPRKTLVAHESTDDFHGEESFGEDDGMAQISPAQSGFRAELVACKSTGPSVPLKRPRLSADGEEGFEKDDGPKHISPARSGFRSKLVARKSTGPTVPFKRRRLPHGGHMDVLF